MREGGGGGGTGARRRRGVRLRRHMHFGGRQHEGVGGTPRNVDRGATRTADKRKKIRLSESLALKRKFGPEAKIWP